MQLFRRSALAGPGVSGGGGGQRDAPAEPRGLVRRPVHAGSWYSGSAEQLRGHVQRLLAAEFAEGVTRDPTLKAVISPHAGLSYSGAVAAGVYARIDVAAVQRIFLIGPSHHAHVDGCGLPGERVVAYRTPLGDLPLDTELLAALRGSGEFSELPMPVDEAEHSIEMQLPFLAELFLRSPLRRGMPPVLLVPMLVGSTRSREEARYGQILAPYLEAEGSLFVISSDFCHWGAQFGYTRTGRPELAETYRDGPWPENAAIEGLDREGMHYIARQDARGFRRYLQACGNTICGRHPILVLLEVLNSCAGQAQVDFVKYAQSSAMPGARPPTQSSVSYACGCVWPVRAGMDGEDDEVAEEMEGTKQGLATRWCM